MLITQSAITSQVMAIKKYIRLMLLSTHVGGKRLSLCLHKNWLKSKHKESFEKNQKVGTNKISASHIKT